MAHVDAAKNPRCFGTDQRRRNTRYPYRESREGSLDLELLREPDKKLIFWNLLLYKTSKQSMEQQEGELSLVVSFRIEFLIEQIGIIDGVGCIVQSLL